MTIYSRTHDSRGNPKRIDFSVGEKNQITGPDDCVYENMMNAIHIGLFDLCPCSRPTEVYDFLCDALEQFDRDKNGQRIRGVTKLVQDRPEIAAELIAQFLDSKYCLDHGTSVNYAWITELGKQVVEIGDIDDEV